MLSDLPAASEAQPNPVDQALTLSLEGNHEAALRWAAGLLVERPLSAVGLLLVGRESGILGHRELARRALEASIERAIETGALALAVVGCSDLRALGFDPAGHLQRVAQVFARGSPHLVEHTARPPVLAAPAPVTALDPELSGRGLLERAEKVLEAALAAGEQASTRSGSVPEVPPQPLFSALEEEPLRAMLGVFESITVPRGAVVIEQGAPGNEAFVVARGELEVRRTGREGEELLLARLGAGALFGEMALLSRAPRAASVVTVRPSLILLASREALEQVAAEQPALGFEIAAYCRRRMLENLVRLSPLLAAVGPQDRASLISRFVTRTYEPGQRLITQGEMSDGLHLIASGKVVVSIHEPDQELVIAELGVGEVVGEVALVLRRPANANVTALLPTVTLHLPRAGFLDLIESYPSMLAELYQLAVRRDEETSSIVAQQATEADEAVLV